jgi:NADH-quinone oxidoreductase subunit L
MESLNTIPTLLGLAWLLPLASFVAILFFGPRMGPHGRHAAGLATAAIAGSLLLSIVSLGLWLASYPLGATHAPAHSGHADAHAADAHDSQGGPQPLSGDWYTLYGSAASEEVGLGEGRPRLRLSIGWYVDGLTVLMFVMVTLIATCIHVYASGYMHDELHEVTDHEVTLSDGHHLHRPGRFPRFFQALSLFCFSMLGILIAGNLAMVFIFWELVGICSWFLIGFYYERSSASTAANKAFIVNRVGDFGMLIGLMALWGALGTLQFGELFEAVRPSADGHALRVPDGMVSFAASERVADIVREAGDAAAAAAAVEAETPAWREAGFGRWLLFIAGVGIFCGCVGKSAQFPLFVWLPDAMEGPTPVSALVHSATMVAAGVYLAGRFYPVLSPEVLLVIAYVGAITLVVAATIALVATDIKRVLAYSTVSQLGYMMLAIGVGGWVAGLFHLVTHAFFKSLLFLCSGSVIHACHTNDMRKMGGLLRVMPYTGWTMLIGCLAIAGAGIPFVIGLSGYYSKDAILAQALSFTRANPAHWVLFAAVAGGAFLTAFYMFRLWFLTFLGRPRDHRVAEHAHESPRVMVGPLVVLAALAVVAGWQLPGGFGIEPLIEQARPAGTGEALTGDGLFGALTIPAEHDSHEPSIHRIATMTAFSTAAAGVLLAAVMYVWGLIQPLAVAYFFRPVYRFLAGRWYIDELYHALFVTPTRGIASLASATDRGFIDGVVDGLAALARRLARLDAWTDRVVVDGLIDATAAVTWRAGIGLRRVQTGRLRQYVLFIAVGTVAIFVLATLLFRTGVPAS